MKVISKNTHDVPFLIEENNQVIEPVLHFLKLLHLRGSSPKTIRSYAFDLLSFYRFLRESALAIDLMQPQHVTDFLLLQRKKNRAPRTINRRLITIRSFLNAQYDGLGDQIFRMTSPAFYKGRKNKALLGPSRIQQGKRSLGVKVPSSLITPLSPADIRKFLVGLRKYRDIAILYLMLLCGLRSCEVLALDLDDIDLIDDQIYVRGKGGKHRVLPISPAVHKALMNYLDCERPESSCSQCFVVLKEPNRGQPMTPEGLRKLFRNQRKKSVKKAHPHLFRHTYATNLIQQGVSLPVVQKLLGHSDIEVTMGYLHLSPEDVSQEYHRAMKALQLLEAFGENEAA